MGGENGTRSQGAETRERTNYEVSETARELLKTPGGIKRLSVAVLVDGIRNADGVWSQRSPQELNDLRDLVSSAIGYEAARGDSLTIKSMEFEAAPMGVSSEPESFIEQLDVNRLVTLSALGLILLLGLLFALRLVGNVRKNVDQGIGTSTLSPILENQSHLLTGAISEGFANLPAPDKEQDALSRLRDAIHGRQEETLEVLRSWMEEKEGRKL